MTVKEWHLEQTYYPVSGIRKPPRGGLPRHLESSVAQVSEVQMPSTSIPRGSDVSCLILNRSANQWSLR